MPEAPVQARAIGGFDISMGGYLSTAGSRMGAVVNSLVFYELEAR